MDIEYSCPLDSAIWMVITEILSNLTLLQTNMASAIMFVEKWSNLLTYMYMYMYAEYYCVFTLNFDACVKACTCTCMYFIDKEKAAY